MKKFTKKSVFTILIIFLLLLKAYNSFAIFHLAEVFIHELEKLTSLGFDLAIVAISNQFLIMVGERYPTLFRSHRLLKASTKISHKIPVFLLYAFFAIGIFSFVFIETFDALHHYFLGIEHVILHKSLHFLEKDKECKWYRCVCFINRYKRKLRRKFRK